MTAQGGGEPVRRETKLTERQERFAREYLVDLSPADAYLRAGYKVASREAAWKASSRLLKNVEVLRIIDQARRERMERIDLTGDEVVGYLTAVFFEAFSTGDSRAALAALVNVGQLLGIY